MVVVVLIVIVAFVAVGLPRILAATSERGTPMVVGTTPCADLAACAVTIQFSGQIDRAAITDSLRVTPPTTLIVTWKTDTTLAIRPAPFVASTNYVVSVIPFGVASGVQATETPVVFSFVVRSQAGPVTMLTPTAATPTAVPTTPTAVPAIAVPPTPAAQSTATPVAVPTATAVTTPSPATSSAAACAVMPVRGFGLLYKNVPDVADKLGCARGPEAAATALVLQFDHGQLVRRSDRLETVAMTADGHWTSYPDAATNTTTSGLTIGMLGKFLTTQPSLQTTLGAPKGPERSLTAAVEDFDRGSLVWTSDQIIYSLYAGGTWEQHPDTFVDVTATAAAAAPKPGAATAAAGLAGCGTQIIRGFGIVYHQNAAIAAKLNCATSAETAIEVDKQTFENGVMLRLAGTTTIDVLRKDGTWSQIPDTYQEGQALSDVGAPPSGRYAPVGAFGALWRQQSGPQSPLGWATTQSGRATGAVQPFVNGRMIWTPDRQIYALTSDGTYQAFPDTFVDATATPAGSGG
jgi:hypothetical protein